MSTLATFEALFARRVRDAAAKIAPDDVGGAIQQAVKRYASVRPVEGVQDYAGDGVVYDLALPTGFVDGWSTVLAIEYPQGEREPTYIEKEDWIFYRTTTSLKIRLLAVTPAAGKTARVTFTKLHTVDGSGSTIPAPDEDAVADLAGAIGLRQLAAVYANTVDASIAADSVDYKSKASEYSRLANELEKQYRKHLGLDDESETPAAMGFTDVDQTDSLGRDKLTHPNRNR